jgi:tRNA A-37 threonylcarbamoyl transferase component Bud32
MPPGTPSPAAALHAGGVRHPQVTTVNIVWEGTSSQAVDPGWVPTRMGGAAHRTI